MNTIPIEQLKPGDKIQVFGAAKPEYDPDRDYVGDEYSKWLAAQMVNQYGGCPLTVIAVDDPFVLVAFFPGQTRLILDSRLLTFRRVSPDFLRHFVAKPKPDWQQFTLPGG